MRKTVFNYRFNARRLQAYVKSLNPCTFVTFPARGNPVSRLWDLETMRQ